MRPGTSPPVPSAADLADTVRAYLGYDSHGDWQHFAIPALDALVARCEQLARERDEAREQVASATIACNVAVEQSERDARRVAELEAALPEDTPELRHWLGSQDVIGSKTTVQIARFVHSGLAARAALEGDRDG